MSDGRLDANRVSGTVPGHPARAPEAVPATPFDSGTPTKKRVPLKDPAGNVIGEADVDLETGEAEVTVTDPLWAKRIRRGLMTGLSIDGVAVDGDGVTIGTGPVELA